MQIFKVVFIVSAVVYSLLYIVLLIRTYKPIKCLVSHFAVSLWLFAIINLTSVYTGVRLPFNYSSLATMGALGLPGCILLCLLRFVIFI